MLDLAVQAYMQSYMGIGGAVSVHAHDEDLQDIKL